MDVTLRLTASADAALSRLASGWGVSREEAALQAVSEAAERRDREHRAGVADAAAHGRERYADLLDRLGS